MNSVAMRMCGHAHHDDMLYLGKDPQPSWSYPPLAEGGYADRSAYEFWCGRDPIDTYAAKLNVASADLKRWKSEAEELYGDYQLVIEAATDRLGELRDTYARTLEDPEQYVQEFNLEVVRRWPALSLTIEES